MPGNQPADTSPTAANLKVLDPKSVFDATQMYRHGDIADLRTPPKKTPKELEASKVRPELTSLWTVKSLHGETVPVCDGHHDIIKLYGADPRTPCVGGGCDKKRK